MNPATGESSLDFVVPKWGSGNTKDLFADTGG